MVGMLMLMGYFMSAWGDLEEKTVVGTLVICHMHQFTALNIKASVSNGHILCLNSGNKVPFSRGAPINW